MIPPRLSRLALFLTLTLSLARAAPTATHDVPSPAPADSRCANLTAAPDGTLHLTYYGPAPAGSAPASRTLFLSSLAPKAIAFSAPRPIVTTPLLMENWADFASLAVGTDGALTAQWFQKPSLSADAHGYAGWFARSTDAGATWTKPAPLGHEFVVLAPLSNGRTLAVWLESTRGPRAPSEKNLMSHSHSPVSGSQLSALNSQLPYAPSMKLMARLVSPSGTSLGDWTVDPDVCTCCQNTVAVLPGDRVYVAYRGHTSGEIRDNLAATFDLANAAWSKPATLRDDGWKIAGCPVNGPAADARASALAVAWFTAADGVARVFAKISADAGRTFSSAIPLDLGQPMGRLETVVLPDGSAVILWMEMKSAANAAGLYARRLFPDGALSAPQLLADSTRARAAGFPRAALRPTGRIVVASTQTGTTNQIRTFEFDPASLTRSTHTSLPLRSVRPLAMEFCTAPVSR